MILAMEWGNGGLAAGGNMQSSPTRATNTYNEERNSRLSRHPISGLSQMLETHCPQSPGPFWAW